MVIARYQKTTKHWPVSCCWLLAKNPDRFSNPPLHCLLSLSPMYRQTRVLGDLWRRNPSCRIGPSFGQSLVFFFFSELEMEGLPHPVARTVEEVFHDFKCRRAGLIKALTSGIDVCICVRRLYFLFFLDYGSERVACLCVYKHVLNYVVWRLICSCFVSYRGCCRSWEILSAVWSRWVFPFANGLW